MNQYITWNIDFRDKIDVEELNKRIDDFIKRNSSIDLVLNAPSTKGATSLFVQKLHPKVKIRIASSYDDDRIEHFKNVIYDSGANCKEAYVDSVIYTRNETIKILREIEEIEQGIHENWTDIQKVLYIYDRIKTSIMYDPKYKQKTWSEVRSLRGLITKQTVCAGYAMIFQEILERNGIQCKFITGSGHAWNVVVIDDIMYSADITSDNYAYRHGEGRTHTSFAQNENDFNRGRTPAKEEPDLSYQGKLRTLSQELVERIASSLITERDYEPTANIFTRNDKSKFYLAQVGSREVKKGKFKTKYKTYYYADINPNGTFGEPKILYAYIDVFKYVNQIAHGEAAPAGYGHTIANVLFSKENIRDSELRNSGYVGEQLRTYSNIPVQSVREVYKNINDISHTQNNTRTFRRKDKTYVTIEYIDEEQINGKTIYCFKVYEMLSGKSKKTVKANKIYTEENLITTRKENIGTYLLHRTRLDLKSKESGGYVGYLDDEGKLKFNKKIAEYFSKNKSENIPDLYPNRPIIIPNFKELEDLARTYEVLYDVGKKEAVVRNIKTKKVVKNDRLALKAIFANIWLTSAGTVHNKEDQRKGVKKAFDKDSKGIYQDLCSKLDKSYKYNGYADTIGIYSDLLREGNIKGRDIFIKLFTNEFQSEYLHRLFYNAQVGYKNATRKPVILHNIEHANSLVTQRGIRY